MLMFFFSSLIHRPSPHHFWCLTWQHKHKMIKAVGNWITVKVVSSQAEKDTLSNANIFCASITDIPHWVYLQSFRWEVNKPIIKVFAFACIPSGLWVLQLWILLEFNVSQRKKPRNLSFSQRPRFPLPSLTKLLGNFSHLNHHHHRHRQHHNLHQRQHHQPQHLHYHHQVAQVARQCFLRRITISSVPPRRPPLTTLPPWSTYYYHPPVITIRWWLSIIITNG